MKVLFRHALDVVGHSMGKAAGRPVYSTKTTDAYNQENIVIGKNVQLAGYLNPGKEGRIIIGDNVAIGHFTSIVAEQFSGIGISQDDVRSLPKKYREIIIGAGAWIGNNCVIMASVGKGAAIGAGSVVVRDVPDYVVAIGNPARIVSIRRKP